MPSEFVQLYACGTAAEADHLLWILKSNGVPAFVDGANTNAMLSHVGSALGGVRLFVRAADQEAALQILESAQASSADLTDWYCGECQELVDANFEVCWSCDRPREEVEQPLPKEHDSQSMQVEATETSHPQDTSQLADFSPNPYASPGAPGHLIRHDNEVGELPPDADAILQRAWRASILSIVFIPIVINLYSMYLLMHASAATESFSPRQQRLFYATFAVNLAISAMWGLVIGAVIP